MAIVNKIMALSGSSYAEKVFNCLRDCGFQWDEVTDWSADNLTGTLKKYADASGEKWVGFTVNGSSNRGIGAVTSACTPSYVYVNAATEEMKSASISYSGDNLVVMFNTDTGFPNSSVNFSFGVFVGTAENRKTGEKTMMAGFCNVNSSGGNDTRFLLGGSCAVDSETLISSLHSSIQPLYIDRTSPYLVTRDITGFTDSVADSVRLIIADTEAYCNRAEWVDLNGKEYYRNGLFLMTEEG